MSEISFKLTAGTDVGLERSNNEDNFIVNADLTTKEWFVPQPDDLVSLSDKGCLMVVADGMGGMNAGEVASKIAIDTMKAFFSAEALTESVMENAASIEKYMKKAVVSADSAIKATSREDSDTKGMGTTIVIAWLLGGKAYICWCGDSRAYSFHPSRGLKQLSRDHSYVQELVDAGKLKPEYAFDHPDGNIITRSLGDPNRVSSPDFMEYPLHNNEVIMLCSDGLSGLIRDKETERIISETFTDPGKCKAALIQGALDAGGYDNITVALCVIISGGVELQPENDAIVVSNSIKIKRNNLVKIASFVLLLLLVAAGLGWYFGSNTKETETETVRQDSVRATVPVETDTDKKEDEEEKEKDTKETSVVSKTIRQKADTKATANKLKAADTAKVSGKPANELNLLGQTHTVVSGETITSIAKKYAVKEDSLLKWNNIPEAKKDSLQKGAVLKIKKSN